MPRVSETESLEARVWRAYLTDQIHELLPDEHDARLVTIIVQDKPNPRARTSNERGSTYMLITLGMLKTLGDEEELNALLLHEFAHSALKHRDTGIPIHSLGHIVFWDLLEKQELEADLFAVEHADDQQQAACALKRLLYEERGVPCEERAEKPRAVCTARREQLEQWCDE